MPEAACSRLTLCTPCSSLLNIPKLLINNSYTVELWRGSSRTSTMLLLELTINVEVCGAAFTVRERLNETMESSACQKNKYGLNQTKMNQYIKWQTEGTECGQRMIPGAGFNSHGRMANVLSNQKLTFVCLLLTLRNYSMYRTIFLFTEK